MGGSQLGMAHLYAQARQRDFVREAENLRLCHQASIGRASGTAPRFLRLRALAGGMVIGLGERIRGMHDGEATPASASGLRVAR